MKQISFKLPDPELEFLKWWSEKNAEPISSVYRNATLESFRSWKIEKLLMEYQKGSIGFKRLCRLGNLTFQETTLLLQEHNIDPPISEIIDDYTSKVRDTLTAKDLFKDGKVPERKTPEITDLDD